MHNFEAERFYFYSDLRNGKKTRSLIAIKVYAIAGDFGQNEPPLSFFSYFKLLFLSAISRSLFQKLNSSDRSHPDRR
ncbi:MAG: hypothetical protein AB4290_06960 [Spirulina sp.]